jgi:hypothetical protein
MAATGYTPISLYYSPTSSAVPLAANLANGELALNTADMKLYAKNSSGVVTLLASTTGASGTVQTVSVVSANGFTGTVANPTTTPAITLTTSITGVLKGNGTAISAAVSGTDYAPATSGTSILYGNGSGGFSNVTIGSGISFAGGTLAATGSGGTVTSVAASVPAFLSITGSPITSSGTLAISYSGTALPVANGGTGLTSTPANGQLDIGNGTGFTRSTLTAGTNITITNAAGGITIAATGGGTVTSVAQSFTGGLISVAGSPITSSGTLALTVAGTSGGIPYFSSASTWATSAALTQYGVVYGGGAGATPVATAAGTTGQVLTATTGGAPTWASPSGGSSYTAKTSAYTAAVGDSILADTSSGSFTITLPASPTTGGVINFVDSKGTWYSYPLTVARNGKTIMGLSEDLICAANGQGFALVYNGTEWRIL